MCVHVYCRLLPEPVLFSCMVAALCSMPEQGDASFPLCVLRSALYLLAVCQDKSPELDWVKHTRLHCPSFLFYLSVSLSLYPSIHRSIYVSCSLSL